MQTIKLKDGSTHTIMSSKDLLEIASEVLGADFTVVLEDLLNECEGVKEECEDMKKSINGTVTEMGTLLARCKFAQKGYIVKKLSEISEITEYGW